MNIRNEETTKNERENNSDLDKEQKQMEKANRETLKSIMSPFVKTNLTYFLIPSIYATFCNNSLAS